jgi:hypothetical protein
MQKLLGMRDGEMDERMETTAAAAAAAAAAGLVRAVQLHRGGGQVGPPERPPGDCGGHHRGRLHRGGAPHGTAQDKWAGRHIRVERVVRDA